MIDPAEKEDIERLKELLVDIRNRLQILEAAGGLASEWYTLRQAARLKRGVEIRDDETHDSFYRTLCAKPRLRPNGGHPDAHIGGKAVWHRDTIGAWLAITDEDLEAVRKVS